jgi:hypothetical protein
VPINAILRTGYEALKGWHFKLDLILVFISHQKGGRTKLFLNELSLKALLLHRSKQILIGFRILECGSWIIHRRWIIHTLHKSEIQNPHSEI